MAAWIGSKEVAFLLAQAPELPAPPANWEESARQRIFFDPTNGADLRSYLRTVSYGKARLVGDVYGPFQVTAKRPDGSWHIGGAMEQAVSAATANGALGGVAYFCVVFTDQSAYTKLNFGWLDPATVATVAPSSGTSTFTVHALSSPLASAPTPGRVHAVKLPTPSATQYYLIEARLRTDRYESATSGVSSGLPAEGVVVNWIDESAWPPVHRRATLTTPGASFSDQAHGTMITTTGPVLDGFAVTVDRSAPADCARISDELATIEAEIRDLQADLEGASPDEKGKINQAIKRLQTQAGILRARAEELGCGP
jgi:hypothetical protein